MKLKFKNQIAKLYVRWLRSSTQIRPANSKIKKPVNKFTVLKKNEAIPSGMFIAHFWAEWNGWDNQFSSDLSNIVEPIKNEIQIKTINVDDWIGRPELVELKISAIPAFALFIDRKCVKIEQGQKNKLEIRSILIDWKKYYPALTKLDTEKSNV